MFSGWLCRSRGVPRQGLGNRDTGAGLNELSNGLARHGVKRFYVEAVIGTSNLASIGVATRLLSDAPVPTMDSVSGEPALAFTKLVEC
ncbi:protein of unknown function [Pseudomonas sp. JV551A1]|uniref:Uncharacterized protein n=1 Tax=Pseudomonas inefficax TaxID=2078786 RepID=A0AAQ1SRR6_9PSED|nr:protein of unknown function [Pseudomonas sp. JV551A1]SPO59183.1 protein of unknown function [Pseudomonas inefficax]